MKLVVLGIIIGSLGMWAFTYLGPIQKSPAVKIAQNTDKLIADFKSENETIEEDAEDVEANIDEIKDQVITDDAPSDDCNSKEEKAALLKRRSCNQRTVKAKRYWTSLEDAEKAVLDYFKKENAIELKAFTECNAIDLTWYEMHCETDRQDITVENFQELFRQLKLEDLSVTDGRWRRRKPNFRKTLNPRWIERSRLTLKGFKLNNPWQSEPHPTENEVVILLEQKLGGKVYIVGLAITGVGEDD